MGSPRVDAWQSARGAGLKLRLLTVGKAPRWIDDGFAHYARRMPPEHALELVVVSARRGQTDEQGLLAALRQHETAVVFEQRGKPLDSEGMATLLADWRMAGRDVALLVGGVAGLSAAVCRRAEHVLSLSAMTFPHQLVRVLVAEQLYRASTILAGHPYHQRHQRHRDGRVSATPRSKHRAGAS